MKIHTLAFLAASAAGAATPTYHRDVAPILAKHCQGCHRAGEIGPMQFTSYKETRPWAAAIKASVASKRMPPWFADPAHGKFANDRSMPLADIQTLVSWVDGGAPEGSPGKAAPAPKFLEGWNIPQPDLTLSLAQPFEVPKSGEVDYQYIVIPTGLTEDKWVRMVEARPTDRSVVHHIVIYIRDPKSKWLRGEAQPGVPYVPPKKDDKGRDRDDIGGAGSEILTIYTPGNLPDIWKANQAKFLPAGSDLVFQMHYTPNGKNAAKDQSRIGLVFANQAPEERILTMAISNSKFAIPPGDPNYKVDARITMPNKAQLLSFFPHMHLRGKAFAYDLQQPGKEKETLLNVPRYDFNWQLTYKFAEPITLEPGAKIGAAGWFDNSPNNKYNPDPTATVRFGEQSAEEMMIGFFDIAIDAKMPLKDFFRRPGAPHRAASGGDGR
jgi:hypothetical protein